MSAITSSDVPSPAKPPRSRRKQIIWSVVGVWIAGIVFFLIVAGASHKAPDVANNVFSPTNEFKLDTWFKLGPIAFNKAILYLLLTALITLGVMLYTARRLRQKPGRLQAAVEMFYDVTSGMASENLNDSLQRKYFPLIATIFVFILVTNLIGYVPLPVNSVDKWHGLPTFQLYAADTNVAFPLIMALLVFVLFTWEGLKAHHGPFGYVKSLMPVSGPMLILIGPIEILSYFLRLISLTVRLWANLLAGHMLIAFMGGELGVLTGSVVVAWALLPIGIAIFLFEAVLIAALQAFIFAILTAIYLGSAASSH